MLQSYGSYPGCLTTCAHRAKALLPFKVLGSSSLFLWHAHPGLRPRKADQAAKCNGQSGLQLAGKKRWDCSPQGANSASRRAILGFWDPLAVSRRARPQMRGSSVSPWLFSIWHRRLRAPRGNHAADEVEQAARVRRTSNRLQVNLQAASGSSAEGTVCGRDRRRTAYGQPLTASGGVL